MSQASTAILVELARVSDRQRSARELALLCALDRRAVDATLTELASLRAVQRVLSQSQEGPLKAMWRRVGRTRAA